MKSKAYPGIYSRLIILLSLLLLNNSVSAQRKFKPHEILHLGNGEKIEILQCRGEGGNEECDVIYYKEKRQSGKRMWKPTSAIREEIAIAKKTAVPSKNQNKETLGIKDKSVQSRRDSAQRSAVKDTVITKNENFLQSKEKMDTAKIVMQNNIQTDTLDKSHNAGTSKTKTTTIITTSKGERDTVAALKKLSVFIDCSNTFCDLDFIRTEITLVDFYLDMIAADVHVLITSQPVGSGGSALQLIFYGQHTFRGKSDTVRINIDPNATDFEKRIEMLKGIKMGLVPYISSTAYAGLIDINLKSINDGNVNSTQTKDKWNYWVFKIGGDGTYDLEEVYENSRWSGYTSANRTTDKIRISFGASGSYNKAIYKYENEGTITDYKVLNTDYQLEHSLTKALSNHWGIGYRGALSNSTFSNNKRRLYLKAAIEYSIYPYKEVNNRLFTISYGLDARSNSYYDTTILLKLWERLWGHSLQANTTLNQKWGTFSGRITYTSYLHDMNLNNISGNITMNVRITGGLSFYMYATAGIIRDQIYLVNEKASQEEIFTRRRQVPSDFTFYSGAGLFFRFGSKLNNFINPIMQSL